MERLIRQTVCFSLIATLFAAGEVSGQPQRDYLAFADKVRMVNCAPAATAPCFRLKLNAVNAVGAPISLNIPPDYDLVHNVKVLVDNQEIAPFYAAAEAATAAHALQGRSTLVLVDISGSMKQKLNTGETRFQAAKEALSHFLDNFQDGVDEVAIVPFESHGVESVIRGARFTATKREAQQQIDALPSPAARNNTALYSSVVVALDVFRKRIREGASRPAEPESSLIVMTDGKNEVSKADDAGLLDGSAGLEGAASQVQNSGIQVIGVGFGNPAEIDETALRRISTSYYMARDSGALRNIFAFARKLLTDHITVTFASPWPDRASLSGRTLNISAQIKLASGTVLTSAEQAWVSPEMGIPVFSQNCSLPEMKALLLVNKPPETGIWFAILRPSLVFAGLGSLILILWFWVPRLVWPERYLGGMPALQQRWMNSQTGKMGRRAPTGFGSEKTGDSPAQRTPADATIVQPGAEFTRTRLDRNT